MPPKGSGAAAQAAAAAAAAQATANGEDAVAAAHAAAIAASNAAAKKKAVVRHGDDDLVLKYSTFVVPPYFNAKNVFSTYMKNDEQIWYNRRQDHAPPFAKRQRKAFETPQVTAEQINTKAIREEKAGRPSVESMAVADPLARVDSVRNTIVFHPGSRNLRIGRATDTFPVTVPQVIARRQGSSATLGNGNAFRGEERSSDQVDKAIAEVRANLRARMKALKLRGITNASHLTAIYNEASMPEPVQEFNDTGSVEWTEISAKTTHYVAEQALNIPDPEKEGYGLFWPMQRGALAVQNGSIQQSLNDLEIIWRWALAEKLAIRDTMFEEYYALLIIPANYDRHDVEAMVNLLFEFMGFCRVTVMQDATAATFGAGLSAACVVDIGAQKTSIACVEDGICIQESRITMPYGGDDMTWFWVEILKKSGLPYRSLDLNKYYSWRLMSQLRERFCVLIEAVIGLNIYDFYVREPDKTALKYTMKLYDEPVLAPISVFSPNVFLWNPKDPARVEYEERKKDIDDTLESANKTLNTAHIRAVAQIIPLPEAELNEPTKSMGATGMSISASYSPSATLTPRLPEHTGLTTDSGPDPVALTTSTLKARDQLLQPAPSSSRPAMSKEDSSHLAPTLSRFDSRLPSPTPTDTTERPNDALQVDPALVKDSAANMEELIAQQQKSEAWQRTHDRIPLDQAVFNSLMAAGGEERIKRMATSIVVVGGVGYTPGLGVALQDRLSFHLKEAMPGADIPVSVIPPPREIDPQLLSWKGASVLGRCDVIKDLWIFQDEWRMFGMRALRDKVKIGTRDRTR